MNLGDMMKQAQEMQKRMQDAQKQLENLSVTGESGGGMVKLKINGRHVALALDIHDSLYEEGDMLNDLVIAAINDAVNKVETESQKMIGKITAGLNIPTDMMKEDDKD